MTDMEQITKRLDEHERQLTAFGEALRDNTALTQQVADGFKPLSELLGDLEAGTRIMCRIARGVSWFLRDIVEPFWKPTLIMGLVLYWIFNDHKLPELVTSLVKLFI